MEFAILSQGGSMKSTDFRGFKLGLDDFFGELEDITKEAGDAPIVAAVENDAGLIIMLIRAPDNSWQIGFHEGDVPDWESDIRVSKHYSQGEIKEMVQKFLACTSYNAL